MKAVRIHESGGSDVLKFEDIPTPTPGDGEILLKLDAAGINYIDTYQRSGMYPMPLPFTPGNEGAGVVDSVGSGVNGFAPGDKVGYSNIIGSYAEFAVVPAARAVKLPAGIDTKQAAAIFLQGMTAHYLAHDTYALKKGDVCLVHSGAGGVGLLLIQMAKAAGATVITTVSTDEKAELAKGAGADHVIFYTKQDFVEETKKIAGGNKVDVVYDAVGVDTFEKGLDVLRPRGLMALYGASSGPVPPFNLAMLAGKGSLYVTRPSLGNFVASRKELEDRVGDVMKWVASGKLKVRIGVEFPLAEAKAAHDALEGRKTTGKVLLIP